MYIPVALMFMWFVWLLSSEIYHVFNGYEKVCTDDEIVCRANCGILICDVLCSGPHDFEVRKCNRWEWVKDERTA